MLEVARNFEQFLLGLKPPAVLAGVGLGAVIAGLVVWLGGLGFRKLLAVVAGAAVGGACGFAFFGRKVMPLILSTGAGVVAALALEGVFFTLMAAALAGAITFAALASLHGADFSNGLKQAFLQMPRYSWAVTAAAIVAVIPAGVYLRRFLTAVCCAAVGTILIFVGMISLLLFKGSRPIDIICSRTALYAAVFVAMVAFGAFEQLLLCQRGDKARKCKKEPEKEKGESEKPLTWRTQ